MFKNQLLYWKGEPENTNGNHPFEESSHPLLVCPERLSLVPDYCYYDRLSDSAFQLPLPAQSRPGCLLQQILLAVNSIISFDLIFTDEAFRSVIGLTSCDYCPHERFPTIRRYFPPWSIFRHLAIPSNLTSS